MPRKANTTVVRTPPGQVITFLAHEFRVLKVNTPGPSGDLGGYQKHENWLVAHTDPRTLQCELPPKELERTIRYAKHYGPGGPNKRIRTACIPALRRAGIELLPDFCVP